MHKKRNFFALFTCSTNNKLAMQIAIHLPLPIQSNVCAMLNALEFVVYIWTSFDFLRSFHRASTASTHTHTPALACEKFAEKKQINKRGKNRHTQLDNKRHFSWHLRLSPIQIHKFIVVSARVNYRFRISAMSPVFIRCIFSMLLVFFFFIFK